MIWFSIVLNPVVAKPLLHDKFSWKLLHLATYFDVETVKEKRRTAQYSRSPCMIHSLCCPVCVYAFPTPPPSLSLFSISLCLSLCLSVSLSLSNNIHARGCFAIF